MHSHREPVLTPVTAAPLRTRIKMCGFTREADVDAAVARVRTPSGFVLYDKSPRSCVSAQRAAELARRLPPYITPVLLFVNASPSEGNSCLRNDCGGHCAISW
jgi:phosphoribosylanthranilate isomerase